MVGFEPTTYGLRNRCSATELHWHPKPDKQGKPCKIGPFHYRAEDTRPVELMQADAEICSKMNLVEQILEQITASQDWNGGNIDADPARPDSTPEQEAVHVIQAIKTRHPIPVICIAAYPVAGDAVLAAGADGCLDIPTRSAEITSAVAACLGL